MYDAIYCEIVHRSNYIRTNQHDLVIRTVKVH